MLDASAGQVARHDAPERRPALVPDPSGLGDALHFRHARLLRLAHGLLQLGLVRASRPFRSRPAAAIAAGAEVGGEIAVEPDAQDSLLGVADPARAQRTGNVTTDGERDELFECENVAHA